MELGLKDKVAVVTGAGRGVGRGVCLRLAEEGAKVVVNDFHDRRAQRVAEELRAAGAVAMGIEADVTDMGQVRTMMTKAAAELGSIDILVNNAGIPASKPGEEIKGGWEDFYKSDPEAWVKVIDVNMYGTMNCTHAVLSGMVERRYGKIVNVMSEAGRVGEAKLAAYSAAKAGMLGFAKALAREVGKHRINVNVVALGAVDAKERDFDQMDEKAQAMMAKLLKSYPIGRGLKRMSWAGDVANAIAFLVSDRAEYITGQVLGVSGGFAMQ